MKISFIIKGKKYCCSVLISIFQIRCQFALDKKKKIEFRKCLKFCFHSQLGSLLLKCQAFVKEKKRKMKKKKHNLKWDLSCKIIWNTPFTPPPHSKKQKFWLHVPGHWLCMLIHNPANFKGLQASLSHTIYFLKRILPEGQPNVND